MKKMTTGNLVQRGFSGTVDTYLTQDSNGIFLPGGATEPKIWVLAPNQYSLGTHKILPTDHCGAVVAFW